MSEVKTANVDTQTVESINDQQPPAAAISDHDDDDILCGIPPEDMPGELLSHEDSQSVILIPEDVGYADSAMLEPTDELSSDDHPMMVVDDSTAGMLMPETDANGICTIVSSIEGAGVVGVPASSLDAGTLTTHTDAVSDGILPPTAINGHQLIIIMADGTIAAVQQAEAELVEPPTKRFKVEVNNDKAYMLALSDNSESAKELPQPAQQQPIWLPDRGQPNDVTQAWFTTRDDKVALQNKGKTWKQGQWCKEEIQLLEANINQYCKDNNIGEVKDVVFDMSKDERKDFYRTIARGLNRPLFSVYRRVIRMYDKNNYVGKYMPEELEKLKELRCKHGTDWASIGAVLGRSASSVKDRCRLMKETCNSGKWLPEEEKRLADAVYEQSGVDPGDKITSGLSWASVSEKVSTRSEKQCRTKWLNYLNWKQSGGSEWTRDDDIQLVEKICNSQVTDETQIDWVQLAKDWSSVRSPQWLRGKWWTMKRYVIGYQMLSFPDLLECVRQMHQQYRGHKPPGPVMTGTMPGIVRMGKVDLQGVTTVPNIISIPVLGTECNAIMTTSSDAGTAGQSSSYEAYEVLAGTGGLGGGLRTPAGTFYLRKPQTSSSVLSFTTTTEGNASVAADPSASEHIFVTRTLPVVQMSHTDHTINILNAHMLEHENSHDDDPRMTDPDQISSSIQLEQSIHHSDDDLVCQIGHPSLDAVDHLHVEHVTVERARDSHSTDDISVTSPAVSVVTTTQSELMHMSSFSDPMMMMSDSSNLMCSASDNEDGKDTSHDTDSLDPE